MWFRLLFLNWFTFCSSSLELLCVRASETLEINRLKKLYNVCHATTNKVKLWVKWSRVSSAISSNNVIKHTNCNLMKKYIFKSLLFEFIYKNSLIFWIWTVLCFIITTTIVNWLSLHTLTLSGPKNNITCPNILYHNRVH